MSTTYNQALFTTIQKSLSITKPYPIDSRTFYYDDVKFAARPYQSTAEVLTYLNSAALRGGNFVVVINTGGIINATTGTLSGGTNAEWWFKDGVADSNLVRRSVDISQSQIDNWDNFVNTVPTLQQVLTSGSVTGKTIEVGSVILRNGATGNSTELDTRSNGIAKIIMFPDASGTVPLTVNGIKPNDLSGDIFLNFYTRTETYNKTEIDAKVGSSTGGVAGVTTFNSRTGAVTPQAGDYTKTMVGLDQVDNTSDATKDAATATLTNKTLTSPKIATIVNGAASLTVPTTTGTLALTSQLPAAETGSTIKAKLGITTLSGINTGDQDLSVLVAKETGKSLVADSEISRLSTVQNVNLIQGANVTISGTYPNLTIASTGGGGTGTGNVITVPAGTNSYNFTAGTLLDIIIVKAPTATTFKAGYTGGGNDVVTDTDVTGKQPIQVLELIETNATIFFTKAADTTLTIYTR